MSLEAELPVRRPICGVRKGDRRVDPFPPPVTRARLIAGAIPMEWRRGIRNGMSL